MHSKCSIKGNVGSRLRLRPIQFQSPLLYSKDLGSPSVPALLSSNLIDLNSASQSFGFPGGSVVKNLPANAGDVDLIPWLGRFFREGNGNILAWEIPWTEEPGGLQSMGSQRVGHDLATKHHHHPELTIRLIFFP